MTVPPRPHHGPPGLPMAASPASPLLWVRATTVATISSALGVVAHVSAGGLLPNPVYLIVLTAGLTSVVAPVLISPAGYRTLLLLVGAGQAAVHAILTAAAGHGPHSHAAPSISGSEILGARATGAPHLLGVAPAPTQSRPDSGSHWVSHLVADLSGTNALMSLAHLAAAAGVAFWLWRGEQALWTLISLLVRRLTALPRTPALLPVRIGRTPPAAGWSRGMPSPRHQIGASITRRGPPRILRVPISQVAAPLP